MNLPSTSPSTRPPSVLVLVPARSGSQRIPGKNLRTVAGIPLVGWAVRRAGEGAVEVAAVGQVAGLGHHAEHVDDGDGEQHARKSAGPDHLEHPPDDLQPVELVAVDDGRQPQPRPRPLTGCRPPGRR